MEAWQGQGTYGAVYRAVRVGREHEGPVALKLARYPGDARFRREAELLSRVSHPSIPRLLGHGELRHAPDVVQPWIVMEWVEGPFLYEWGERYAPSHRQVCQVLAHLARALEALHATGAVHRDVKGGNVLVRLSDQRAMLMDLGSGHFQGASRLTWRALAPGSPAYQSAQAGLFHIRCAREPDGYYAPTPADDLFALGVTGYRLVMGEYPPPMDAQEDEQGGWHVWSPDPRLRLERNARVRPMLRERILRLLSDVPEKRGSAAELAEALEAEVERREEEPRPAAVSAAGGVPPVVPASASVAEHPASFGMQQRGWRPWLALGGAVVAVMAAVLWHEPWPTPVSPGDVLAKRPGEVAAQVPDAGSAAVGDSAPAEIEDSAVPASEQQPIAQEPPPELRPGQTRPNKKGQCPGRTQVVINGGCWVVVQTGMSAEDCLENGHVLLKGKCYAPALELPQKTVPTSGPREAR